MEYFYRRLQTLSSLLLLSVVGNWTEGFYEMMVSVVSNRLADHTEAVMINS